MTSLTSRQSLRQRNDKQSRSKIWKKSSASTRRFGKDSSAVRPLLLPATHLQEVQLLLDRTSRTRAEEKARAAVAEIIGRRGIHLQPLTSRDISTILPALPNQVHHRIYKSESASKKIGMIQRSNSLRSSHLAILEVLMQAAEEVSDLAIEAREQAKIHCADPSLFSPSPCPALGTRARVSAILSGPT